jgi:D-alanyl-lipoteichoic acid acyltransferase DltB (MBOAT superfamily)
MTSDLFSKLSITSNGFFFFVLITLGVYYLVPKKAQNYVILIASFLFCLTWDWTFALILFASAVINYFVALKLDKADGVIKTRWFWVGITANLGTLLFYKYFDQTQVYFFKTLLKIGLTDSLLELNLLQPIGISFYTLQAISYVTDVYRKQIPANKNFVELSLYLAYFPKLLAGPIERAQNFFAQLQADVEINNERITESFIQIFVGLTRKLVISETIAQMIPLGVFASPQKYSMPDLVFWWLTFAFVIYNDFAGYTSIARGISGLFGIQLSPNFEQPFFSTSYIDFWNRWHISLSNWLRDYVYLPVSRAMLRRNPSGRYWPNLVIPPLVTMIISGIWHGAAWHFILWGALNGLLQGYERVQKLWRKPTPVPPSAWKKFVSISITLLVMIFISVPFKLDFSQTLAFWGGLVRWNTIQTLSFHHIVKPLFAIGLSFFIDVMQLPKKDELGLLRLSKNAQVFLLVVGLLLLFLSTRQQAVAPFIYQEF